MGLFEHLGQQPEQAVPASPEAMRQEIDNIKHDPAAYLSRRGFRVPAGMTDPKEITVHLLRSGQVGGAKLQQIMRLLGGR